MSQSQKRKSSSLSPPSAGLIFLNADEENDIPKLSVIDPKNVFTVGRGPECYLKLMRKSVSKKHASFYYNESTNKWTVLSHVKTKKAVSVRGTYIEKEEAVTLDCGNEIQITPFLKFRFLCCSDGQRECCSQGSNLKKIKLSNDEQKEEENTELELETMKEETEMLKKQNADLKISVANLEDVLERNKHLEEELRNRNALQTQVTSLETENSNLLNDICRTADDMVKLTEKCEDLQKKLNQATGNLFMKGISNPITYTMSMMSSFSMLPMPFESLRDMFKATPVNSDEGVVLRKLALEHGAIRCVLAYLAAYSHYNETSTTNSGNSNMNSTASSSKKTNKAKTSYAKGTGYATGNTNSKWNVDQTLHKQRFEEENVAMILEVLAYCMNSDPKLQNRLPAILEEMDDLNKDFSTTDQPPLPTAFVELVKNSPLVPILASYLRNDSILDIVGRISLYRSIFLLLRVMILSPQIVKVIFPPSSSPDDHSTTVSIVDLLRSLEGCVDTYWFTLTKNKIASSSAADKELAEFVCDVRTTTRIFEIIAEKINPQAVKTTSPPASIEEVYLRIMKKLQWGYYDMISECDNGYKFNVTYVFEQKARKDEKKNQPARIRRIGLETASIRTNLPLSFSTSVFVRCDTDRLDVMKVLIIGPAETPYANGCFVFDIYFPANYPNGPMFINMETTGKGTVRFNPNLYNDGKVCLSVLNTWSGSPEEKWNAQTSSLLQVLVSIQSLILVPDPYFNEPGYEKSRGTAAGNESSRAYNANIIQATVRWAILDQIKNPSPCFKEIIETHFWLKRKEIIEEIEKWVGEIGGITSADTSALKSNLQKLNEEFAKLKRPEGVGENEGD